MRQTEHFFIDCPRSLPLLRNIIGEIIKSIIIILSIIIFNNNKRNIIRPAPYHIAAIFETIVRMISVDFHTWMKNARNFIERPNSSKKIPSALKRQNKTSIASLACKLILDERLDTSKLTMKEGFDKVLFFCNYEISENKMKTSMVNIDEIMYRQRNRFCIL